jgi:hypothetical protein
MKHIRTYDSYRNIKSKFSSVDPSAFDEAIKESVLQVGDVYKVRSMVDIPQSLINSYVKKVKDTTGKNLRQFFGDVEIAEQLLQYITTTGLDLDKIPGGALMGQAQAQGQPAQAQTPASTEEGSEGQAQVQGQPAQAQEPVQTQVQPQSQAQVPEGGEFEEPNAQAQPAQAQPAQTQVQTQVQPQGQAQEGEEENEEENEEGEEELPL